MNKEEVISVLIKSEWKVTASPDAALVLPTDIAARYSAVPKDVLSFLGGIQLCANPDETAWFLTRSDFDGSGGSAFRWNEFECMSLDAAADDSQWQSDIKTFWDSHFPFMTSVKAGYAYFAISLHPEKLGTVVNGYEHEFEKPSAVASSFSEFLELLCQAVRNPEDDGLIQASI